MPRAVPPSSRQAERQALLQKLRVELARLEGGTCSAAGVLPLGLPAIDGILPGGGLARGCLHEVSGTSDQAAAGFATVLLGRLADTGPVVWIGPRDDLFAPGLAEFGLDPARLIVVRARGEACLWALEEVLSCPGVAAGLAEAPKLGLTRSRRLQLAAEGKGVTALLLRPAQALAQPSAAFTRWRVAALASAGGKRSPRWRVELTRARGGRAGVWGVEWRKGGWHEIPDPLALAATAADRPDRAARPV